jgi:hypothetical protein
MSAISAGTVKTISSLQSRDATCAGDTLLDASGFGCLTDSPIELARRNGRERERGGERARERAPAGKQPTLGQDDTAPLALAPPEPQQFQQLRRQHGIAVLASLALLDPDQHMRAVDVADLEGRYL